MENTNNKSNKTNFEFLKKWWFWLIAGIIILSVISKLIAGIIFLSVIGKYNDNTAKKIGKTASDNSAIDSKADKETEFKVGDIISFDGKEISITNIQRNYNVGEYKKAKSEKEFIKITIKIKNQSDSDISVDNYNFYVQDSNGVLNDYSIWSHDDDGLESKTLVPGGEISGSLLFEIPKGDKNLKLIYKPSFFFSDKKIVVKL
ncbi:MAG: DUF4352 domain-containing protein [Clostridia bacterium]|nr:DUF4352 domain-containing protein [Clostridia bacterium]